jgi:hypothetical protein
MNDQKTATKLTFFEKTLIISGLLFFANAIYVSFGGSFLFNYIAKAMYLLGIAALLMELLSKES